MLAHILTLLNRRHDYGLDLFLLSVDEGITGQFLQILTHTLFHLKLVAFLIHLGLKMMSPKCTCCRLQGRLPGDREEERAAVPDPPDHCVLPAAVRVDHGCHRTSDRAQEQLHLLRGVQATGPRQGCFPVQGRQNRHRSESFKHKHLAQSQLGFHSTWATRDTS